VVVGVGEATDEGDVDGLDDGEGVAAGATQAASTIIAQTVVRKERTIGAS
jgi:hypothetical protein